MKERKNTMKKISAKKVTVLLLLIAPAIWLIASCSSTPEKFSLSHYTADEWTALVNKTIPEQERAAKVKQLGLQLIELANSTTQDVEELSAKATMLNENYKATKEETQRLFSEFSETRKAAFAEYRDIIFAMRKEVSAEEWEKLTD